MPSASWVSRVSRVSGGEATGVGGRRGCCTQDREGSAGASRRLRCVLESSMNPGSAPAGPIPGLAGVGMPVVGMVGGVQLARMTAAAAVGLGTTFRVLTEADSESAALVTRDVAIGSHL